MPGTYPPGVQQIAHGIWSWTARHPEWHPGVFGARVVSFALPGNGRTVLIDPLAPHWVPWLRRFAEIIAIPVLAVMAWEGWKAAQETLEFHDVTSDLAIHRILYWIPVLFGLIGGALAAVVMIFPKNEK